MKNVQYKILGPLEVSNGAPIRLGSHKQTVLLATLLMHPNEIVSTDRLIEAIWPDEPPRTANHSVQIYVSELRKLLASPDLIETRSPGYRLQVDPSDTDVGRFDSLRKQGDAAALRQSLELWRGDPLADFTYESFAQPHIRRLEEARAATIEALAEAELAAEDSTALPLLLDLAERQPLREGTRRLLMLTLYRQGRIAEALRVYREFRRVLVEELGLEPSTGLQTLEEQILLQEPIGGERPPRSSDRSPMRNPYKGLEAFSESDAADYFGRQTLIADLADRLETGQGLVAVVGPSGSGKSSLVRAGLLPRLRTTSEHQWLIATMVPGRHPFEELGAALHRAQPGTEDHQSESGILKTAIGKLSENDEHLLLFIDQFEELFTLTDQRRRRLFLRSLCSAVSAHGGRFRLVLTMRADFYDRPLVESEFARLFADGVFTVTPLTGAELESAALEPARRVGVTLGSDLIAEIVTDMVDQPGALPLFEYTLTDLFERRTGSEVTLADYHAVGGLSGALIRSAESTYESLDAAQQAIARQVLLHLVKVEQGNQAMRRRVPLAAVRLLAPDADLVDDVLLAFGKPRLLLFDRDPIEGHPTVEVTHESLLAEWPRLRDWIDERRIDLLRRDALTVSSAEWESSGRNRDYLLTGTRLASFNQWKAETDVGLGTLESEFLDASLARLAEEEEAEVRRQAEAERRTRRVRRRTTALVALAGLAAMALTLAAPRVLDPMINPAPRAALAFLGSADSTDPFYRQVSAGWERWLADSGQRGEVVVTPEEDQWFSGINRLAERGTPFMVVVGQPASASDLSDVVDQFPDSQLAVLDWELTEHPRISGIVFDVQEGSFLAGVAAARQSKTGRIGFVGGQDSPLIWGFEAGFEAGVRAVDPDISVETRYLAPWWDGSGFISVSRGRDEADALYRSGVDVVYHAAGYAGYGVFDAAVRLSDELDRHLWAIGVDEDQHAAATEIGFMPPFDPEQWPDHILTSMVKRLDNATYEALTRFEERTLEPGPAHFGIAEDAVGLAESGGFLESYASELDSYRQEIASELRTVPQLPQRQTAQVYAAAVAGLIEALGEGEQHVVIEPEFADVGYPSDRRFAPISPWVEDLLGPPPDGMVFLDRPLPAEGDLSTTVREQITETVGVARPQASVDFLAGSCAPEQTVVALGPGRWDGFFSVINAMVAVADGSDGAWYLVTVRYETPLELAVTEWERLTDWSPACT